MPIDMPDILWAYPRRRGERNTNAAKVLYLRGLPRICGIALARLRTYKPNRAYPHWRGEY